MLNCPFGVNECMCVHMCVLGAVLMDEHAIQGVSRTGLYTFCLSFTSQPNHKSGQALFRRTASTSASTDDFDRYDVRQLVRGLLP